MLRADAWERLFRSKRDGQPLVPILALCGDENGESLLGIPPDEEDSVMEEAAEFIPACVAAIDAYWRAKRQNKPRCHSPPVQNRPQRPVPLRLREKIQKMLRQSPLNPQHTHYGDLLRSSPDACAARA